MVEIPYIWKQTIHHEVFSFQKKFSEITIGASHAGFRSAVLQGNRYEISVSKERPQIQDITQRLLIQQVIAG